ncbi:MAG: VWA domain-containing protein, partial [Pseudomonadota bacterium]
KNLINIVLNDEKFENTSKIALVPFSTFVNVGETYFERVTGTTVPNGNDYTCVAERDTTDRYTDASPDVDNYFSHLKDYYPDIDDVCPTQSTIVPLTNDKTVLETNIDSFSIFRSSTAGHLATAFAWYTLSPRWKHIWFPDEHEDEDNTDVITTSDVRRITVLMTDGRYNAQYSGDPSKDQALRLCENIKNEGIVVYAVGFDIPKGSSADEVMLECASSEGHYYNAANGEELKAAYHDIAMKMFLLRVSK